MTTKSKLKQRENNSKVDMRAIVVEFGETGVISGAYFFRAAVGISSPLPALCEPNLEMISKRPS